MEDAAISHHAALQFHGRSYSIWNQVTFLTRSHTRGFRFGPMEYLPSAPALSVVADLEDMGGGIETIPSGGDHARVCTLERAMVDDVLHTSSLGGRGWEGDLAIA